jgi:hypothetical protein
MHSDFVKNHKPNPEIYRKAAEIIARGEQTKYSCNAVALAVYEQFGSMNVQDIYDLEGLYVEQYAAMFGPKTVAAYALDCISGVYKENVGHNYVKNEEHVRHPYWNDGKRPLKDQRVMAMLLMAAIVEAGG